LQWQARFGTEEACLEALKQKRWPEGFRCPKCGHDRGSFVGSAAGTGLSFPVAASPLG
jgi:hypothetical protein